MQPVQVLRLARLLNAPPAQRHSASGARIQRCAPPVQRLSATGTTIARSLPLKNRSGSAERTRESPPQWKLGPAAERTEGSPPQKQKLSTAAEKSWPFVRPRPKCRAIKVLLVSLLAAPMNVVTPGVCPALRSVPVPISASFDWDVDDSLVFLFHHFPAFPHWHPGLAAAVNLIWQQGPTGGILSEGRILKRPLQDVRGTAFWSRDYTFSTPRVHQQN
ncbi:uncharacterized protein LOC144113171 [Amblyomma americanum]|uniref:Uncharacterized protein n=1 Tax=Amblyomma americanum TaxID=6943 RepID=A0AAQ4DLL0_AMBAM